VKKARIGFQLRELAARIAYRPTYCERQLASRGFIMRRHEFDSLSPAQRMAAVREGIAIRD
jgi:hypothetical protein